MIIIDWKNFESCVKEADSRDEINECVSESDGVEELRTMAGGRLAITTSGDTRLIEYEEKEGDENGYRSVDGIEIPTIDNNPFIYFLDKHDNPVDNCRCKNRTREEQEEDMKHRFHSTDPESLESISIEGLRANINKKKWGDSFDAVFVSKRPCFASKWQIRNLMFSGEDCVYEEDCPLAVLRIDEEACDNWKWDERGTTEEYGYSWYCEEDISPESIELRAKDGWVPIEEISKS